MDGGNCQSFPAMGKGSESAKIAQHGDPTVGTVENVVCVVHMPVNLPCPVVFVHALAAGHIVLHGILLIFGMGERPIPIHVVAGQGMLETRAAHHGEHE